MFAGFEYTYDPNGNIISVKDVQSQTTTYEYTNNDLTKQTLPSGAALTYTYDTYHNVETATSDTGVVYNFAYDTYGNNTSVSIVSGSVALTSSAAYTSDGNRLSSTTDAAGKVTTYSYNGNTNVLEWVKYPNDTDATKTEYSYDAMYRLAKAEADVSTGDHLSAEYKYSNDLLESIETASTKYSFSYGPFALRSDIKIGNRTLASYDYTSRNNFLDTLEYGNGDSVKYTYDKQGRVTKQTYEDDVTVIYKYDNSGALAAVTDSATGITTTYYYDYSDRLLRYMEKGNGHSHIVGYEYDNINNLTALVETINGESRTTEYTYDDDNRLTNTHVEFVHTGGNTPLNVDVDVSISYDAFGRIATVNNGAFTRTYNYHTTTSGGATSQLASFSHTGIKSTYTYEWDYSYEYDDNGNITAAVFGNRRNTYVYDSANQLIRENNDRCQYTQVWEYDDAGNIVETRKYTYTTGELGTLTQQIKYEYDSEWGDLLTKYNGQTITHDEIGNMTSDGTWTYEWEHGRQLKEMSNGTTTWTYTYDANGMRTSRSNGTDTYKYYYNGDQLTRMVKNGEVVDITYSAGQPATMTYDGATYYYVLNGQGDVIGLTDSSGNMVIGYTYGAYGVVTALVSHQTLSPILWQVNPLTYRGYVYDRETTLYYLQSRYYNPAMGRFINSDDVANLGSEDGLNSFNLFAYCANNPVNRVDDSGSWSLPNWAKVVIGVGVIAAAAAVTVATGGAGASALVAAIHCAAQGALVGAVTQGALGAVTGGISGAVMHRMTTGSWSGATNAAIDGAATGFMSGAVTGAITGAISSPYCFGAGTTVLTATGAVAIETIQKGDHVWAWDEETGEVAIKEVVETYVNETDELVHVFVNGEEIVTTPAHPFYSPIKGWTDAAHLRAGDILVLLNGEYVVVEKVQHEILETPVTVYNFQVEDYHTYYVGRGVLVHNTCKKYYKANRTDNGIDIGSEITKKQALSRLRNGDDVYASSRAAAKALAKDAYGNSKVYWEIHNYLPNAKKHFHDMVNHSFHVFFD